MKVIDGIGGAGAKKATWDLLMKTKPSHVSAGFELFFTEDTQHGAKRMSPAEVMALTPRPAYIVYEWARDLQAGRFDACRRGVSVA